MRRAEGAGEWKLPRHFDGKRYYNPNGRQAPGFRDLLRWKRTSRPEASPKFVADVEASVPPKRVESDRLRITMVNHSTVLLQQRGLNILTDPIWSERTSPLSWIGPKRRRKPGVAFENLPEIDIILISHNHYDHLDLPTVRRLIARRKSTCIVPQRLGRLLRAQGAAMVHEMDWGEWVTIDRATIHCVPAFHFSSRGLFDRNRTPWCGYVIECGGRVLYFAGDTAFGDHFSWIRERLGPPDVALLPIGAYEPRWFMSPVHMAPDEAIRAHEILGARTSIAIHHGTFQLADEGIDTPRRELLAASRDRRFVVLRNGEFVEIP
jgi:L-ascorbate metabolism protein UlaG (beta-lactamase superfamily)